MGAAHDMPVSANDAGAKALVQSLGESLHVELRRNRIQVMTLVVPPTNTAIIEKVGMKPMSTTRCVSAVLRAFRRLARCALPGMANRIMSTIIPTSAMHVMMGWMIENDGGRHKWLPA
jgi:short-subunit dehydrogenase